MTIQAAMLVIVALAATIVTAIYNKPDWSEDKKRNASVVIAAFLGAVYAIVTRQVSGIPNDIVDGISYIIISAAFVITAAQGFYRAFKTPLSALETKVNGTRYIEPDPEIKV